MLEGGADVAAVNGQQCSALHYAAEYADGPVVVALMEGGADPHKQNSYGRSALDIAREVDNKEAIIAMGGKVETRRQRRVSRPNEGMTHR